MIHKTHIAYAKAVDEAEGLVEAFTNTMGVMDADGDIVDPVIIPGIALFEGLGGGHR